MKFPSLNTQILIGAIIGIVIGIYFHTLGQDSQPVMAGLYISGLVGGVFIDLLKMVLVPLVFSSITVGIANLQKHHQAQRVWKITMLFFLFSMTVAIVIGLSAANIFRPGAGLHLGLFANAMQNVEAKQMSLGEFFAHFLHGLFVNPVNAMAQGNIFTVIFLTCCKSCLN
jgi:Na+/H+-dicarboxylate symporter